MTTTELKVCQCGRPLTIFKAIDGDVFGECSERATHIGHDSFLVAQHTLSAALVQRDRIGEVWVPVIDGVQWPERRGSKESALRVGSTVILVATERGWFNKERDRLEREAEA